MVHDFEEQIGHTRTYWYSVLAERTYNKWSLRTLSQCQDHQAKESVPVLEQHRVYLRARLLMPLPVFGLAFRASMFPP